MNASGLTPGQRAQMDNRDAEGKWRTKTHAQPEDTAAALGLDEASGSTAADARPDSAINFQEHSEEGGAFSMDADPGQDPHFNDDSDQAAYDEYLRHIDGGFSGDDEAGLREEGRRLAADVIRDRRGQGLETDDTDLLTLVHPQLSEMKYGPEQDEIAAEAKAVQRGDL